MNLATYSTGFAPPDIRRSKPKIEHTLKIENKKHPLYSYLAVPSRPTKKEKKKDHKKVLSTQHGQWMKHGLAHFYVTVTTRNDSGGGGGGREIV